MPRTARSTPPRLRARHSLIRASRAARAPSPRISVLDFTGRAQRYRPTVRRAVAAALRHHRIRSADIRVAIVDDSRMASWNRRHLDHPGPTDVLTFDHRSHRSSPTSRRTGAIDADIAISLDTAQREARARGHSVAAELALYTLHGLLHLLGHNDRRRNLAARMHRLEDVILATLGFGRVYAR